MAKLILEITSRNDQRFVPIERGLLRVGRALDNDVILTDPTVSAHHFLVKRNADGSYLLYPLSDENGLRINRKTVKEPVVLDGEVLSFEAGRTRLRVLPEDTPVAPTRLINCLNGGICLFESRAWTWALLALFVGISLIDNYLSTPQVLDWQSFGRDQLVIIAVVLIISAVLTLLVRLLAQRWEPYAVVSFVCLMLLVATVLDQLASFSDYFWVTSKAGFAADLTWAFLIAPVALYWFFVRVNHGNNLSSLIITIALASPAAYFQFHQAVEHYGLLSTFSEDVHYPQELFPLDVRKQSSLTVDQFISDISELKKEK